VGLLVAHFVGRTRRAFSRGTGDDSFSVDDLTTCDLVEGVPTEMTTIAGRAAPRLLEVSSDAEMLVIAGSGGALADYVSRRIAVRAGIPVVVVRGQSLCGRRPIAVGVTDRSADHVLGTAFSAAADRGCGLLAARAYIVAASHRAQLVVVGRHGRSMLAAGLSGSPVAQLLRRAACPVFLARQ
jgi:nucleotide-binding universal stress UspA family protein